ncbi:MAG: AraC family transcriptional regulator [Myxococcaceae bacterium]|nr:AraC family transcriptional regulator [Myxococcaceae bacterium]
MLYAGRNPSPPLDAFIERIWSCSDSGAPLRERERALPGGGTVDLIVNLVEDEVRVYDPDRPERVERTRSGAVVTGARTRSILFEPRQRASAVGVHFKPGGAFAFLGISPWEIVDASIQVGDLWGRFGRSLHEQLLEASTAHERFDLLEAALLERLRHAPRRVHPAARLGVRALAHAAGTARVSAVAASLGLSRRRFVEVFEREVGVTPKLFARLRRFHRVKQHVAARGQPASWGAFALECGYFDQSHMIRDFVEFSGMTPTGYVQSSSSETVLDHLVHSYAA